MRHIIFEENNTYNTALLVKSTAFNKQELINNYVAPLEKSGVLPKDVIAFNLKYNEVNKAPAKFIKEYLDNLLPALDSLGVKYLYVADANYFKVLSGQARAEPHLGYVFPCKLKGYEHINVVLGLNYQALIYNPDLQVKLDLSLKTLSDHIKGTYQVLGHGIIHSAWYPKGVQEIARALESLHQYPRLTADIEAFSLLFTEAGIGTITFCWDQHNGLAFACDYKNYAVPPVEGFEGYRQENPVVRALIKNFLETYQGEITWHHASYDVKVIIYTLWMKDALDTEGLLTGLDVLCKNMHDTKIITYLAINSTAGNVLGLKSLAHEFAGNWAVEVKDIRKVPLAKLLEYNLIDGLSTAYVRDKYYPIMVEDNQDGLYRSLMLPSLKLIIQIELIGMPLDPVKVKEVKTKLEGIQAGHLAVIRGSGLIKMLNLIFRQTEMEKANAKLKVKQHPLSHFDDVEFNPNSGPQLQRLLYEQMGLPVLDLTDTKQPATGADTLEKLINHTTEPTYKALLAALIGYGKATKVLSTFIPAFEAAIFKGDNVVWLHGSFNLGGTVSGRLSSSDPNLQNIPANSIYGKLIKECFVGPTGWLFCGADFNSLEDMISALTTKDPNKLKVYTDGFDGHCLRAAFYYADQLPHIDLNDPKSVNSIAKTHKSLRQDSKTPTFALTYQGTYHTLMVNEGWDEVKARMVEAKYHEMYKVSDEYIQTRLEKATKDGFVEVAFGLRVRTPLLGQVVWGTRVPYEAAAEGRTAGNAMGQSYGLLNNRAAVDFMIKVWASKYRFDIKPVGLIHDAIYILVRDRSDVMEWANRELIKSMQWQELPEIQHPTVKLGAALDVFWPSWAKATTLPNNADRETIFNICQATKGEVPSMA
jgi:DNA polymerase-1